VIDRYLTMIDGVTSDRIQKVVNKMLLGRPTLVVTGNAVNLVPSVSDVQGLLR
jgi:hypothetical protein